MATHNVMSICLSLIQYKNTNIGGNVNRSDAICMIEQKTKELYRILNKT